jgi:UDP-N-acetylmuramoylalanine--D-glutamate ligase
VLLNLAPDHLDWHGSMDAYRAAKARIYERQTDAGDVHVGNRDDPAAAALSKEAPCHVRWFRLGVPSDDESGYAGDTLSAVGPAGRRDIASLPGRPASFRADAAAAVTATLAFGVPVEAVAAAIGEVRPLPHRGEVVAVAGGIRFVDDSKATNPHAALASLEGRDRVVLIAGGLAKGLDLSPLTRAAERLDAVVAIGRAAPEIERCFSGIVPVSKAESIEQAVSMAYSLAPSGGTVLLAPACASQDMFRDYAERGERFATAARAVAADGEHARGTDTDG